MTASISVIAGTLIGALGMFFLNQKYTTEISNQDMISWDVDRALHLAMLAEGKAVDVMEINFKVIEDGIANSDYHSKYPGTKAQTKLIAKWVDKAYHSAQRPMPKNVKSWIAKHK
ncbi:hypothetical protein OAB00_02445 [Akkermansiaceae bacterium]|nr:hypothetical protein [Akkermansiaceae bacterium]